MAAGYGFDISRPAENAREAFQWLYFGYLAAIKENNGAAMSFGRTATFLDIYLERDFQENTITEEQAQELVDQLVTKLRLVRHLRTPDYDEILRGSYLGNGEHRRHAGRTEKPCYEKLVPISSHADQSGQQSRAEFDSFVVRKASGKFQKILR